MGYMGSGKSSVGAKLSKVLNYDFVDFDAYIENQLGMTVNEIFNTRGEVFFRKQEHLYLKEVLELEQIVVALGGGTPCYGNNLELVQTSELIITVYLKSSIKHLVERLFDERNKRPLISHLNSKDELMEFIGKHLFERSSYYEQANIIVNTDELSVSEVVESVLLQLF